MVFKHLELYLSNYMSSLFKKQNQTVIEELSHRFSITDIRKLTNNFDESRLIGRGDYCRIYRGCLECDIAATDCTVPMNRTVEVKQIVRFSDTLEEFKNEIELLCQLNHPNLVSLIGFCDHKDKKIRVYEYMSNGSLDKHLNDSVTEPLSWKKRLEICIGIARGLHYLHSGLKRTIIHRGVKLSNILLDSNMVPKLTGFGLSLRGPHFMSEPKPIQAKIDPNADIDTFSDVYYVAYECLREFSDKSDVYAFGVILLQVVCANQQNGVFANTPIEEKIDPVLEGKIAPKCWEIYVSTLERCLKDDPNERPTMGEVEVELEQALRLQEQPDIRDNNAYYTLLSNTILDFWVHNKNAFFRPANRLSLADLAASPVSDGCTSVEDMSDLSTSFEIGVEYMSDSARSFEISAEMEENDEKDSVPRS